MKLLLLSNSRAPDGVFLHWARDATLAFFGRQRPRALFIPYAAVPGTREHYDHYAARVRAAFADLGCEVHSIHEADDPEQAIRAAEAFIVGGGNSFHLLHELYRHDLLETLREQVRAGVPYLGWSAGSLLACRGIWTTNDMPIIEPPSLRALGFVPFQINPHFTDAHPPGHQGETRMERIAEFLALNPGTLVLGLREGAGLHVEHGSARLFGTGAHLFRARSGIVDLANGAELSSGG